MKPEDIAKDRAVIAAATPPPWTHEGGRMVRCKPGGDTVPMRTTEDARFAVAARERWPAALDYAEEMQQRSARATERIEAEIATRKDSDRYDFQRAYTQGLERAAAILRGDS